MMKSIKKLIDDESGSVLPMIAVIIALIILLGAYEIGLTFVYRDRDLVRDALDSAVTSALASSTICYDYNTHFYEVWISTDDKGGGYWKVEEGEPYSYIYIDYANAQTVAKTTFKKIIGNRIEFISIKVEIPVYGKDYQAVIKDRTNNPQANPDTSWVNKFGDAVAYWGNNGQETNNVRFPKSVMIKVTAQVKTAIPLGNFFGKETQTFQWTSSGVKELSQYVAD